MVTDRTPGVDAARRIADLVARTPGFRLQVLTGPVYAHMGATICDAILQAGLNYRTVVAPRIRQLTRQWPTARRTSAFAGLIRRHGVGTVLRWRDPEKPRRIVELTEFLAAAGVETEDDLREWMQPQRNAADLRSRRGIGPKTFDYLKRLVGIPTIAVDRHIRSFVRWAGLALTGYEEVSEAVASAADLLGVDCGSLDYAIWRHVSNLETGVRRCGP